MNEAREDVVFNGVNYRRYPLAKSFSDRMYFRCSIWDKKRGFGSLHRDVYLFHFGEVPVGWHIHHKDGNALNNEPSNLEALPRDKHNEAHVPSGKQRSAIAYKKMKAHLDAIRPMAGNWHGSKEGKLWHSQHGKEIMAARKKRDFACDVCGSLFSSVQELSRFCSNNCKSKARLLSGVDNEQRNCKYCGVAFPANKYQPKAFCSRSCGARNNGKAKRLNRPKPDLSTT